MNVSHSPSLAGFVNFGQIEWLLQVFGKFGKRQQGAFLLFLSLSHGALMCPGLKFPGSSFQHISFVST